jgi:UDP-glucose 4-epimerase
MRAIVTGGAGFIGSHLCERLLAEGHSVVAIDNLACGRRENLRFGDGSERLQLHVLDVRDSAAMAELAVGADWVFHLAGLADIVPSIERPEDYFEANVRGTLSVLEAARKARVSRFVYAASSSCYGVPSVYPTPETAPALPEYPYALTKYQGEQLVLHWAKVYGLPALSLRLFNVFGPRSRTTGAYGAVFGVFLAQKLAGKPLTVVGDGTQTRDFTYVADVVDAFVRAAQSDLRGEVFNVGTGHPQSVNRLVELIGGERVNIPKRPGEPDQTCADVSKIARLLGWRAATPFEAGVATLLSRIDDYRDAPVWEPAGIARATRAWFECLAPAGQ